jgi:hypothetical protein
MTMAAAMEPEQLRARLIRSLRKQGFRLRSGQLVPPDPNDKDQIRRLHDEAVRHRVAQARAGLERNEDRLLSFIARGTDVTPEGARPRMVLVRPGSADELLHPEILQQLRIFFFGFGLALGQEFQSLQQLVGSPGTALDLYKLFRDPHSAFDTKSRQYSFMTIGPVSPLSFPGSPLFLNAFNTVEAFLDANGLTSA